MPRAEKQIFLLIIALFLIRLMVSPFFGLGVDEAHYILYAKYLDWSYLDHPPLVGWLHAPFFYIMGTNEFLARLPAILLFAATSYCCYLFIFRITQSAGLSLWSVLALNCSFMLNALGLMLLPDSILLLLVFLLIFAAEKIIRDKKPLDFIFLGLVLGLMGLAKYTAILLVPPLIVFFLMKKRYDIIFSPYMVLAAAIALLLIVPVIYWNALHDFASFRYQGSHVFGSLASSFEYFVVSLAAQFGAYSPFLFVVAVYGFFKVLRDPNDYLRLAVLFGGTLLVFFMVTSVYERTLPHWPSVFYLLFIPIGTYHLLLSQKRWRKTFLYVAVGASLIGMLLAYAELAGKFIPFPDYKSPFRDIYGYPEMAARADDIIKRDISSRPKALAVTNWTMGSRVMYYGLPYRQDVFVMDFRPDQFDIWQRKSPLGYDLLFLNTRFENIDVGRFLRCDHVDVAGKMDLSLNGSKVNSAEYVWCRNYQGVKK
ncbi:MAG: phospholipid carrier-dependent glycosyltransferase [Deltaproteobacteria bacterium]|nr:phospholipid carrier-dependent glycosyltransferase [Deltaproteobacteria bacterium]